MGKQDQEQNLVDSSGCPWHDDIDKCDMCGECIECGMCECGMDDDRDEFYDENEDDTLKDGYA